MLVGHPLIAVKVLSIQTRVAVVGQRLMMQTGRGSVAPTTAVSSLHCRSEETTGLAGFMFTSHVAQGVSAARHRAGPGIRADYRSLHRQDRPASWPAGSTLMGESGFNKRD